MKQSTSFESPEQKTHEHQEQKTYQHLIVLIHWTKSNLHHVAVALNFEKIIKTIRRTDEEHHVEMNLLRGEMIKEVTAIEKGLLIKISASKNQASDENSSYEDNATKVEKIIEKLFNDTLEKDDVTYLKSRFMGYSPDVLPKLSHI